MRRLSPFAAYLVIAVVTGLIVAAAWFTPDPTDDGTGIFYSGGR